MSLHRNILGGLTALLAVSFVSCVEQDPGEDFMDPMATSPETDIAALMPNSLPYTVTPLPRHRLDNDNIIDMPDGVHLRPGVKIHTVPPELAEHIYRDDDDISVFHASGPLLETLKYADEFDVVFFGETAFTVESAHRDANEIVFQARPFRLAEAIYGNFRIKFKIPLKDLTDTDTGEVIDPIVAVKEVDEVDPDNQFETRKSAITLFSFTDIEHTISFTKPLGGGASAKIEGTNKLSFETSATVDGVFEGQISYVNESYRCKNPDERSWFEGTTFCVDRLAVYFEMGIDAAIESTVKATGRVNFLAPNKKWDFTKFQVPVGATGLSVFVEPFIKIGFDYGVTGSLEVGFDWKANPRLPLGFEYINNARYQNLPGNPSDGTYIIPNTRYPARLNNSGLNWKTPSGEASLVFEPYIQGGVDFGAAAAGGVVAIKGASFYLEAKLNAKFRLLQSAPGNKPCAEAELTLNAIAEPDIRFEIDAKVKSWEFQLLCGDGPETCAQLDSGNLLPKLGIAENKRKWSTKEGCSTGSFNTVKLTRTLTTPAGRFDIPGYEVDGIALTYLVGEGLTATSSTTYASTGPSKAQGRPDANCDNIGSKVHGITGSESFRFGRDIEPGDTITIVQIKDSSEGCRGSGTVNVSLVGSGVSDRDLGTISQNGSIAFQ